MRIIIAAASVLFALSAPHVLARESVTILGKKVEAKDVIGSEDSLLINGKPVHRNEHVSLGKTYKLAGGAVALVGETSPGGYRCAPEPYVLLIRPDGSHRFDGPIETCMPYKTAQKGEQLLFETERDGRNAGQRWVWTAKAGFKKR